MKVRWWLPALVAVSLASAALFGRPAEQAEMDPMVATLDAHPEKVVALCQRFRADPLAPSAANLGGMLTAYALQTQRVRVTIDDEVIRPMVAGDRADEVERRLLMLYVNGLLTYALSREGVHDEVDANVRALTEVVEGYGRMRRGRPHVRNAFAEELVRLAAAPDGLRGYVQRARGTSGPR